VNAHWLEQSSLLMRNSLRARFDLSVVPSALSPLLLTLIKRECLLLSLLVRSIMVKPSLSLLAGVGARVLTLISFFWGSLNAHLHLFRVANNPSVQQSDSVGLSVCSQSVY
jgi:hypothetical protein